MARLLHNPDDSHNIFRYRELTKKEAKELAKRFKELDKSKSVSIPWSEMQERMALYRSSNAPFSLKLKRFKNLLFEKIRLLGWIIRGKLWDRHNVIKIKTLPCTYSDHDTKILHASFSIFCDLIEQGFFDRISLNYSDEIKRIENGDWGQGSEENKQLALKTQIEAHDKAQAVEAEMKYLYKWWKESRPEREKLKDYEDNYANAEIAFYKEDTNHLIRLMQIREYLWY
jgi:hypothetical protein